MFLFILTTDDADAIHFVNLPARGSASPDGQMIGALRQVGFIGPVGLIPVGRDCHHHQTTRSAFTEGILLLHLPDSCLQRYELQPFFALRAQLLQLAVHALL